MNELSMSRCRVTLLWAALITIAAAAPAALAAEPPAVSHNAGPNPARLPDGHPNWTGSWVPPGGMMEKYNGPSGLDNVPAGVQANVEARDPTMPDLKSPYLEGFQNLVEQAKKGPLPSKTAMCYPPGMPGMMGMIYGMEILQTPKIVAITSEWQAASRRIWIDAKHPPADELDATYTGDSIGHWEGDTLVVDTLGLRGDVPLTRIPFNHGANTRIIERFHQTAPDMLVDDMTIIDEAVFAKPWVRTYRYHYRPDLRLQEYVCLDNNRNVDDQGRQKF